MVEFNINEYRKWYSYRQVLESMKYQLMYREGAILSDGFNIRNMKIRNKDNLLENMKAFHTMNKIVNWYYSLAILRNMPIFSFNLETRIKQSNFFINNFKDFMVGYDLGLDFDSKHNTADIALKEMQKTYLWFKEMGVPVSVRSSGSGFHIVLYSNWLWQSPFHFRPNLSPILCEWIGGKIKEQLNLESLDTSVFDNRRIWKVPYSMDYKTGNICRPLNEDEIMHFDWEMITPKYCVKNYREVFYNRNLGKNGNIRKFHEWIFEKFGVNNVFKIWKELERKDYGNKI